MRPIFQDVKYAVRTLAKTPSVTLFAVISLALGIGANAAIFSVMDAFFWRPFPMKDPARVVMLNTTDVKNPGFLPMSRLNFEDYRDKNEVFSRVAATNFTAVDMTTQNQTTRVPAMVATGNYFDVAGVKPILGAGFRADQDEPAGAHPVAVLSSGCWKRQFGSDKEIVGKTVTINHMSYTIVGVLPESFTGTFPGFAPDIWLPYGMSAQALPAFAFMLESRRGMWLFPIARLKPGVTRERAEASLKSLASSLEKEYPESNLGR